MKSVANTLGLKLRRFIVIVGTPGFIVHKQSGGATKLTNEMQFEAGIT